MATLNHVMQNKLVSCLSSFSKHTPNMVYDNTSRAACKRVIAYVLRYTTEMTPLARVTCRIMQTGIQGPPKQFI